MSGTQGSGHSAAGLGPGAGPCWTRAAWLPQCPAPRLGRPWVSDGGCPGRVGAARGGRDPADLVTGPVRPRPDPGRPRTSPPASKNLAGQGSSDQIEHPGRAWGLCHLEQAQTPPLPPSALPMAETWAASSGGRTVFLASCGHLEESVSPAAVAPALWPLASANALKVPSPRRAFPGQQPARERSPLVAPCVI